MLDNYGESGQPFLVPDFSEITLSFSPFNLMLTIGLLYIAFVMFRYVSCIPGDHPILDAVLAVHHVDIFPGLFMSRTRNILCYLNVSQVATLT